MDEGTTVTFDAPRMRSELEKVLSRANAAFLQSLHGEGEALKGDASAKVPVETGELRSSAFVSVGLTERGNPAAIVGYDDKKAPAVHEGFHGGVQVKSADPDQFWLQTAANRFANGFARRMAGVAKWAVGG